MASHKQPSLFMSHGTMYEAFRNNELKDDFLQIRRQYFPQLPDTIILFSGHWQTEIVTVTTGNTMSAIDEGFPPEFKSAYQTPGNPALAEEVGRLLRQEGIGVRTDSNRGLDHGALIPLLLLFPNEAIPVIQISQQQQLNPVFHKQLGEILRPLRNENILFIGSGGLVHNRTEIEKFGGHHTPPDSWAKAFDSYITTQLTGDSSTDFAGKVIAAYQHELFNRAHPTSEHFLPLVFAAALGGVPSKIYHAFQWKNLSMSAFIFK